MVFDLQHSIFIRTWHEQSAQYRLTYYNVLVLISIGTSCLIVCVVCAVYMLCVSLESSSQI